jgi:tetratricopeptide (TPR) repeat protein
MAEIRQDLGAALIVKQQYRQALGELLKARDLDPENARTHYHLGFVYLYGFNKPKEAEKCLRDALEQSTEPYSEAENLLGLTLSRQGRYEEALKAFEHALTNILYATPQFAHQNLAQTLILMGRQAEGIRRLKRLLKQVPNLCGAYQTLLDEGLKAGDSAMLAAYDPQFMKFCIRPAQVAERIEVSHRRAAYRRAVARCRSRSDHACAFELAQECKKRVPYTVGDEGPACPKASKPKASAGFGGD